MFLMEDKGSIIIYHQHCGCWWPGDAGNQAINSHQPWFGPNYSNPGYGLSLVDTLWNAGSYRQPLEQEGNPMT